jgi:curved DNA-binding protein CbpA
MKSLYDLLGALPDDDAEGLRTAFRRAVKGAHPDIRPGDPDAALRFRQIVRAHEILGDSEQRAAYDHLLELARVEQVSALTRASAVRIRKAASGVMTLVAASVATVGAYLLFIHMASALIAVASDVDVTVRASPQVASINPPESAGTPDRSALFANRFSSVVIGSSAAVPQSGTESILAANVGAAPDPVAIETRLRSPAILAIRSGDVSGAIAYLDQALQFDPKFLAAAYIDHGTIFYRLRRFDHTFAGMVRPNRTAKASRVKSASKLAGKLRPDQAAIARSATPLPLRQAAAQDLIQIQK